MAAIICVTGTICGCAQNEAQAGGETVLSRRSPPLTVAAPADFANPRAEVSLPEPRPEARIERSPIDELVGLETDPERLSEAYEEAHRGYADEITACMTGFGFSGFRAEIPPWPLAADLLRRDPLLDIAQYGYGPTIVIRSRAEAILAADLPPPEPDPIADYFEANPEMDEHTFFTHHDRCRTRAEKKHPQPEQSLPEKLAVEVLGLREQARRSPSVVAAWVDWSRCMALEGYELRSRQDARSSIEEQGLHLIEILNEVARGSRVVNGEARASFVEEVDQLAEIEEQLVAADLACTAEVAVDVITSEAIREAEIAWIDANTDRVALLLAEQ